MTTRELRTWQKAAVRTARRKDLEIGTRVGLAKDVALFEIAIQLSELNAIARRTRGVRRK